MTQHDFQVVVIGSGPGGYVAAVRAAELGLKTACVEKMPTLGGTCLNVGCIPSKALLSSSEHYEWIAKSASDNGINVSGLALDFPKMQQRKEGVVKSLTDGVAGLFKQHEVERINGEAHFVDPHTIEVDGKKITSDNFIIATGSQSVELRMLPFDEQRVISSTGALALKEVPKRLLVIGGVIGVEMASVYQRLGSKVTIIEMLDSITPMMDPLLSRTLLQALKKMGIDFYLSAEVVGAKIADEITLNVKYEQKEMNFTGDAVLVSVGRRPYTKNLGLEAAGVPLTPKGFINVDVNLRAGHDHIYAIGDVIDGPMLAHRSSSEGVAVAETIAGKHSVVNYISIPNVVYTHPEVAAVGLTEAEAKAAGLTPMIGTAYFRGNARARCVGDTDGLGKIVGDKASGRLLGLHIIGPNASEMIAEGMIALDKKATVADIAYASHAHPTLSESIMEAAQNCIRKAESKGQKAE
jgi:dihydrolipoamide dehydrogenase